MMCLSKIFNKVQVACAKILCCMAAVVNSHSTVRVTINKSINEIDDLVKDVVGLPSQAICVMVRHE